jgi:hypothetical protein
MLLLLERLSDGEGEQVAPDGAALRADGGQPAAQVPEVQVLQDEEDDGEADPAAQQHEGGHELGEGQRLAGGPLTLARLARSLCPGAVTIWVKYCVIWTPCAQLYSLAEIPNTPPPLTHLGLYARGAFGQPR